MADIIGSSKSKAKGLMVDFQKTVRFVNETDKSHIRSPLTITLGDEFQGVVKDVYGAFRIIFDMEFLLSRLSKPFKMRYVIYEGEIQTKINKVKAYEMLGPGLTEAREQLTVLKPTKNRFKITLKDESLSHKLTLGMRVYQGIVDNWTPAQQKVVNVFDEEHADYRKVAKRLKKDPTVIWRRKRSLMIEEVNNLKKLIFLTIDPSWRF